MGVLQGILLVNLFLFLYNNLSENNNRKMQVVVTKLPKGDRNMANQIEYLDLMGKKQILATVKAHLQNPYSVTLALASDIDENVARTPASELVTLGEWLEGRGIELERKDKHRLANLIALEYKKKYSKMPRSIARQDDRGKYLKKSYGFEYDELDVLETAWRQLLTERTVVSRPKS